MCTFLFCFFTELFCRPQFFIYFFFSKNCMFIHHKFPNSDDILRSSNKHSYWKINYLKRLENMYIGSSAKWSKWTAEVLWKHFYHQCTAVCCFSLSQFFRNSVQYANCHSAHYLWVKRQRSAHLFRAEGDKKEALCFLLQLLRYVCTDCLRYNGGSHVCIALWVGRSECNSLEGWPSSPSPSKQSPTLIFDKWEWSYIRRAIASHPCRTLCPR